MVANGRKIRVARYWNSNGTAIAIVASITYCKGEPVDWAAYIGGTNKDYEETAEQVAKFGTKLLEHDARHFFPSLEKIPYR